MKALAVRNNAAMNMRVKMSLKLLISGFFSYIPRNGITGLDGNSAYYFTCQPTICQGSSLSDSLKRDMLVIFCHFAN